MNKEKMYYQQKYDEWIAENLDKALAWGKENEEIVFRKYEVAFEENN